MTRACDTRLVLAGLALYLLYAVTLVVLARNGLHGVTAYPAVRRLLGKWVVQT